MASKTKRIPEWQRKLTARQRKHLREIVERCAAPTLAGFTATRTWQIAKGITCHECRSIALALGIEQPGDAGAAC